MPYRALAVATGEIHVCAILDDHTVKCWGNNDFGQLGYGDAVARGNSPADMGDNLPTVDLGTGRTATSIAASRYSTCAILDDGSLKCWGWTGMLGEGPMASNLGYQPGQMGDHLPALDFGGRRAVHLAMGFDEACASLDDDTIWCWGTEAPWLQFWLPVKRVKVLAASEGGVVALYEDGSLSPQLPNGMVPVLTSEHKALAVAGAFGARTCVILDDATTVCGEGDTLVEGPKNAIAIGMESPGGLCSVFSGGSVRCSEQTCAQPAYFCASDGSIALDAPAVAVTSNGSNFACALLVDGQIQCWAQDEDQTMAPSYWLGSEVGFTHTGGGISYGSWHSVDLGTHP